MAATKNVVTPDFGGVTDVTVIEVLVKPGDQIQVDTPIVTLESDKATMEIPSTEAGAVKDIKVKVGDKVNTGTILVVVDAANGNGAKAEKKPAKEEKETKEAKEKKETKEKKIPSTEAGSKAARDQEREVPIGHEVPEIEEEVEEETEKEPEPQVLTGTVQSDSDVHAGPGVRRLARELGVNLNLIPGSGPKQRIIKEDVQTFVKTQLSQVRVPSLFPTAPAIDFSRYGKVSIEPLSRIKKIGGKNLQRNWVMIPHVTQFGEADITTLEEFRQEQKQNLEKQNVKLTPLVFVMKAAVSSLKAFPQFNASLDVSGENLVLKDYYHIGVAVDTPEGLVVPVIRDVDKKGLVELAKELAHVSEKARKKQLTPQEMQGGSFSISSLGGIGGTAFTPIINAPEVAILGVSKASYKPVYQDKDFVPRLMLPLSLSYDHRVIDGADGARFMVHLTSMLSDIRNLLL